MDADAMTALLATTRARIARSWVALRARLREANTVESIADRSHTGDPLVILQGLQAAAAAFAGEQHGAFVHAGQATARWATAQTATPVRVRKKLLTFDSSEPGAVAWAQRNRLDKIREITDDQRALIQGILIRGARSGLNPREVAREIHESIGLTTYQEQIVANYRAQLEQGGAELQAAFDRELTGGPADRTLVAAIRDRTAIPANRIEVMVADYRRNYIRLRAETIARTEGLRVAHQAGDELYRQAVEDGSLQSEQIKRTWVHPPRRRDKTHERSFHRSMHGQVRGYGEPFVSGLGNLLMHPCDPAAPIEETANCACTVTTRLVSTQAA